MGLIQITDNSNKGYADFDDSDKENLKKIADIKISEISLKENHNLLVFPRDLHKYGDEIGENYIISMHGDEIFTGNIMGFVGVNDTQLDIRSRFAREDGEDFFLHYMLQKVFAINLFDIKHTISNQPIFDFLLYLFPYFLKKALAQGLFKKYQRFEYNDANVRGTIDVNRHIRHNIPFRGTIAYTTREHSYDNEITQLVRHTAEYIQTKHHGSAILFNDMETKACVSQIVMATPTYNIRNRDRIISQNLRRVQHPYFSAYTDLQRLCLQILCHETIKYGQEKDKVYGILFDGAWLWEEYLNTVLKKCGFKHPENKLQRGGFPMFEKPEDDESLSRNSRRLYPDFYKENYIVDAKYKHLSNGIGREDLFQVISYMYCKKAEYGGYVFPNEGDASYSKNKLAGYNGYITLFPFHVPQSTFNYNAFIEEIKKSEESITKNIQ